MSRYKELKEQYKQYKPEMGVVAYTCVPTGKVYLATSQNTKADINSLTFRLNLGNYAACVNLANDWKQYGQPAFDIRVIERLDDDKDGLKTDHTAELTLLREICADALRDYEFIN